ncbi:MAG: hypothetical protein QMD82_06815 [bacterium]|nr:hypothetical protein [bacterium]
MIFDVNGREIKRVGEERYWDGRDSQGKTVRPGVYFVRDEKGTVLGKIIKIR